VSDAAATPAYVRRERPAPGIAVVRLDRPERRNALSIAMRRDIAAAVAAAEDAPDARVIVLAGSAACFASGGDIVENAKLGPIESIARGREKRALWQVLAGCSKPIVAAVRGYALGGGAELMMLADIIVAGDTARIGQPEPRVGIMPGSGGTQRLPRAVGKYASKRILLTGGSVSGAEAARLGLVSASVADEAVEERALEIAATIADNPPRAVAAVKQATLAADDGPLEAGLLLETQSLLALAAAGDVADTVEARPERYPGA
jgi:enoyl-CoA hydratase/carnithine racemase